MAKLILVVLSLFLLSGCIFGDEDMSYKKLTKDFWLYWFSDSTNQHILLNTEPDEIARNVVIENTVFAIGYNDNFIIAKQHPDKEKEVSERLFGTTNSKGYFEMTNLADTIYLLKYDPVFQDSGKWYHTNNGWNPPDSLKPYKRITYYHIVDIRNYEKRKPDSYKVYTFDNEAEFNNKRKQLGLPDTLTFTIINRDLE